MCAQMSTAASDLALVHRCGMGDEHAFAELVEQHATMVLAVCRRITGHENDALDALQETLWSAWQGVGRFDGRSRVSTWLYRIAVNESIDQLSRSRRAPLPVADLPEQADRCAAHDQVLDRMVIGAALADMAPVFRSAVVLRDVLDLTYDDIATVLGIKVDTVKSRLSRGRCCLRKSLGDHARDV